MSIYDTLNENQREAVFHTEGPLLILAGAGSGKTRVLTHRVAYLIEQGVMPYHILAITFTNKAAEEMKERVDDIVGENGGSIWVSTFHSMCVRILRRHIDRIGFDTNFTIYDTDDQKTLMKEVIRLLNIDTKVFKERMLLSIVSSAKNEMVSPDEFEQRMEGDFQKKRIAKVYREYEKQLKKNNALDFDDLLLKTVELLQRDEEVRSYYQDRFRYIMVDEYQDTNTVQFELIRILSDKYRNLCVVGDDDQSIYKFRGANIQNILSFEDVYKDARVIKLEQNYRSTQTILDAANAVIQNNKGRKEKALWTDNGQGDVIAMKTFESAYEEAEYVVGDISQKVREGKEEYKDNAILYRTNAQSRLFEEKFVTAGIPYKIVGGVNFYSRREIKDILAYLKTIDNGKDDIAVRRVINVPKRGIGLTSVNRVQNYAQDKDISFYDALLGADFIPDIGRGLSKLESFVALIEYLKGAKEKLGLFDFVKEILSKTEYIESLEQEDPEVAQTRMENIDEFISKVAAYEENAIASGEQASLSGFLEEVALVADIDSLDESQDYVILMTLHSAKGLEFPSVYLTGMEDGLFPSYMTIVADDKDELEEERRLCYVGITRAKQHLTLTNAKRRMIRGETQYNKTSRFLKEIPRYLIAKGAVFEREKPDRDGFGFKPKTGFRENPFKERKPIKQFNVNDSSGPGYDVGDRVLHTKFGVGTVTNITAGGRDYEVTVNFDTAGVKKMFATFAKLQKQ
ncbi:DNA helicase-2/ATP-dependent DNA helicase PcrA [Aequitasia blattaphilus]|uniref:ATP-dependent DNA helicase n=1 Tax=Aequitasia blattaphilus TaxID=2949332 RepID=A0ABT1E921_9FIRM|nr:DNA helicase PcrA [Aequitasia blattaphilus]MCP1102327.1 DNA helicase PcrA [Aequitasia blattaphilus]MCR8614967.1 DNA helicase PcrA [Aequitasia blattaphilus]